MGKEINGGKREKKEFRGNITFDSTRPKRLVTKTHFNTIQTLTTLFYCFNGKKIKDSKTRHDALLGRKDMEREGVKTQVLSNDIAI